MSQHICQNKFESFVDESKLLEANPQYVHIQLQDG